MIDTLAGLLRRVIAAVGYDVRGIDKQLKRIARLTAAVQAGSDAAAEAELIRLRHEVWQVGQYPDPPEHWPPASSAAVGGTGIPMVCPDELTAEVLHSAIARHSCLLVRGLMSEQDANELIAGTDRALDACQRRQAGDIDPALDSWFLPFVPEGSKDVYANVREWTTTVMGTVMAADSPRNFSRVLDIIASMGILDLLTDYFGVRPVLTVPKTALKRVVAGMPGGWHQDVSAYGPKTRALNMWVALSPCGMEAPGLALVPINPGGLVEVLPPAPPLLSISDATISRLVSEGTPVQEPCFEKGDVLFFDTLLPHSTQHGDQFTRERYALECWFFSPTTVGAKWLPLHV